MLSLIMLVFSTVAIAEPITVQVDQSIPQGPARIGVGSPITLKFPGDSKAHTGEFLGQLVQNGTQPDQLMLLDLERSRIFLVNRSDLEIQRGDFQKIVKLYNQVDGTCTGYAMNDLFQQISLNGTAGNAQLKQTFSTEKGRTQFLVRAINDYYIATQHRTSIRGILSTYGKEFGLKCGMKTFSDTESAESYVGRKVLAGTPVLIAFNIGPNMYDSDLTIADYAKPRTVMDRRLWLPRKVGERNTGGHSVLAVAAFQAKGKNRLLMLDSDWAEPRVWNLDLALGGKTAVGEIEFHVCE
jgi:hypothetical protein